MSHEYPHPTLTPIVGEPDFDTVQQLCAELYTNAMSVASDRGGGNHGHLALLMTQEEYTTTAGNNFEPPINPGPNPIHPIGATQHQIIEANRIHSADKIEHKAYLNVGQALKAMIIKAIQPVYINILKDPVLGFANITARQLLQHIKTTYGRITTDILVANSEALSREWSPDDPIENLWMHVDKCRRLATAGADPITDATAVHTTINVLEKSGVFADAIRDWRKRPDNEKTWENLTTSFNYANKERLRDLTTKKAGYHGANQARGSIEHTLAEAHATIRALQSAAAASIAATQTRSTPLVTTPTTAPPTISNIKNWHYCWTHGLGKNSKHTSKTCNRKADGHKEEATITNMMGGNNSITRRWGEKEVYKRTPRPPKEA